MFVSLDSRFATLAFLDSVGLVPTKNLHFVEDMTGV